VYVYFAAGAADKVGTSASIVLENSSATRSRRVVEKGQLKTGWESFALDATTFEHKA